MKIIAAILGQLATAVRAVLYFHLEHPREQPRPTQPHRTMVRIVRLALGRRPAGAGASGSCGTTIGHRIRFE